MAQSPGWNCSGPGVRNSATDNSSHCLQDTTFFMQTWKATLSEALVLGKTGALIKRRKGARMILTLHMFLP